MRARRPRGLHRLHCARRVAIRVSAVCCACALLLPPASLSAQAGPQEQEIGTLHWGPAVVWLRATQTGQVELFASAGFRSAFVQPVLLSGEDADRWAALLDQLASTPLADPAATTAQVTTTDTSHVVLSDGEIVLEMQPPGTSEAKLRVWVGASRPDAVVAVVIPEGAAESARMLREATRAARGMRDAALAAAAAPTQSASPPTAAPTDLASQQPRPSAPPPPPPRPSPPPPAVTTVALTRQTTTVVGFESPPAAAARTAHDHALSVLKTTTTTTPMHLAAPALATVTTVNRAPQHAHEVALATPVAARTSAPAAARTVAATKAADPNAGGVNDVTVQNLVAQWRPDLMYCYTQYGLREHTALAGTVVVRFALSPNGEVGHSVIDSRSWNGAGGTDVETCIRTRVAAWHFPPASAGSMHEFSLEFAPGRG